MEKRTNHAIKIYHIISLYDIPLRRDPQNKKRREQNTYLGEDATDHTGEDGHSGGTHAETGEGGHVVDGVLVEGHQQRGQGAQTHGHHSERVVQTLSRYPAHTNTDFHHTSATQVLTDGGGVAIKSCLVLSTSYCKCCALVSGLRAGKR
jgi:hypothetical protein